MPTLDYATPNINPRKVDWLGTLLGSFSCGAFVLMCALIVNGLGMAYNTSAKQSQDGSILIALSVVVLSPIGFLLGLLGSLRHSRLAVAGFLLNTAWILICLLWLTNRR